MTPTQRFYDIACMFPVMNSKGIKLGDIPGISRTGSARMIWQALFTKDRAGSGVPEKNWS